MDRAVLRGVFIMTANLSVGEDADVILIVKSMDAPEAEDLIGVLPGDEMISEPLFDEEHCEILHGAFRMEHTDEKILSSLVPHDADSRRRITQERMERRVEPPEPVLHFVGYGRRIGHLRIRQFFYPLFFL